jgi:hypothetical protein
MKIVEMLLVGQRLQQIALQIEVPGNIGLGYSQSVEGSYGLQTGLPPDMDRKERLSFAKIDRRS